MKNIGYWRQTENSDEDLPWPVENSSRLPKETQQKVVNYLRQGRILNYYRGWSSCRICGKMNGTTDRTDGEFLYPEGYAHYVESHNIEVPAELLTKILK